MQSIRPRTFTDLYRRTSCDRNSIGKAKQFLNLLRTTWKLPGLQSCSRGMHQDLALNKPLQRQLAFWHCLLKFCLKRVRSSACRPPPAVPPNQAGHWKKRPWVLTSFAPCGLRVSLRVCLRVCLRICLRVFR